MEKKECPFCGGTNGVLELEKENEELKQRLTKARSIFKDLQYRVERESRLDEALKNVWDQLNGMRIKRSAGIVELNEKLERAKGAIKKALES